MKPKIQKPLIFINSCNCVCDERLLSSAMIWFSEDTLKSPRKIFMHGLYPAVSIYDKKIHVHRLIGLYLFRDRLAEGMVIHHKDHDRLNASPDNLQLMSNVVHAAHHNKGKTLTDEHKAKIASANRKRKGIKMKRKYNIDAQELRSHLASGKSINAIAKIYGCDWSVVNNRIHENKDLLEAKK